MQLLIPNVEKLSHCKILLSVGLQSSSSKNIGWILLALDTVGTTEEPDKKKRMKVKLKYHILCDYLPLLRYPPARMQIVPASSLSNLLLHTVPHAWLMHTSTFPSAVEFVTTVSTSLTLPVEQLS